MIIVTSWVHASLESIVRIYKTFLTMFFQKL
jgi:hypothetical protein